VTDLTLNGRYSDYSFVGDSINFINPSGFTGQLYDYDIEDVNFNYPAANAITLEHCRAYIHTVNVFSSGHQAIYGWDIYDSFIDGVTTTSGSVTAIWLTGGTSTWLQNVYFGSNALTCQLYMIQETLCHLSHILFDDQKHESMYWNNVNNTQVEDVGFTRVSLTTNATYNAWNLTNCYYNNIQNVNIHRIVNTDNVPLWGLFETTCDWNVYTTINAIECKYGIQTTGTNDQVHLSYNCTTWVS
jgi:hypothetical protein